MPSIPMQTRPLAAWPRERRRDAQQALETEWLETNGIGDFAASTVTSCPTRRYHGLLVARPPGSAKRHVFLTRMEEHVREGAEGPRWPISVAAYPGVRAPRGEDHLVRFELAPYPTASYRRGPVEVRREVLLVAGQPTVLVRYTARGAAPGTVLELEPMFACREADALTVENDQLDPLLRSSTVPGPAGPAGAGAKRAPRAGDGHPTTVRSLRPYAALPAVHVTLSSESVTFEPRATWYKRVSLAADRARGYPAEEDHFAPGVLLAPVEEGVALVVAATLASPIADPAALWRSESERRRALAAPLSERAGASGGPEGDPGAAQELAARDFLVTSPSGRVGVNAGYPWFGEWGRDTFIALPGLTLGRDEPELCFRGLAGARDFLRDGLLPNVYGLDREDSHYNSVDASLWFARATLLYERATGDAAATTEIFLPALVEIAEAYRDGTGLGVAMDEEGLLVAGDPSLNATWMDAQVDGVPVTPRDGCAVEMNALWYSLLNHVETLVGASCSRRAAAPWRELRLRAGRAFLERFWLPERGFLADRWLHGHADASIRPNMVIAAAQEFSPLSRAQRLAIVDVVRAELLTPFGLRTLAPGDPQYRGTFAGGPAERDGAYHQGTVWPWLLGFLGEADLRARGVDRKTAAAALDLWSTLVRHLGEFGLNHMSEVFDGDAPHRPGGCFAQAWNTAEYLRIRAVVRKGKL